MKSLATMNLISKATDLGVYDISSCVLDDDRFDIWSGSSKPEQHHYSRNGLARHIAEVVDLCFSTIKVLNMSVDPVEVFLSALYHDAGKLYDYEPVDAEYKEWVGTSHKRKVHHISRSVIMWNTACQKYGGKYDKYVDDVTHNILSHHGLRAWGSPVMPKTKCAWLLHLSDNLSARVDDCDRMDFVKMDKTGI